MAGDVEPYSPRKMFRGLEPHAFDILREHRQYRLVVDRIHPTDLRRYGLSSPQGFDPLLPNQFKTLIQQYKPFRTNRLFDIQPADTSLVPRLGLRYFLTCPPDPLTALLTS